MENIGLKPNNQKTRIINAELIDSSGKTRIDDVTIAGRQFIESISTQQQDSKVIDAKGCLLLPGLHDHHTHFLAYAASLVSVKCGPPEVTSEDGLISALHGQPESYWLRGNGFHESVLEPLDRQWLDTFGPNQPIRIQHRSGRLWILNTLGLEILANAAISLPLHQKSHLKPANGHLYDCDELLGTLMLTEMPPVPIASRKIASFGVTGINDMTPSNDPKTWRWFDELQTNRDLLQKVRMSGKRELSNCEQTQTLYVGETKVHLHESALPKIDDLVLTN